MSRDALLDALERNKTIIMTYRRMTNGKPAYVTMKISHMEDDHRFIVVGVSDVDEQVKQQRAAERMAEERIAYARLNALTGDMMCAFIVVPETGRYRQYSAATVYDGLGLPQEGEDFFNTSLENGLKIIYPDDKDLYIISAGKQGFNRFSHIGFRIVARNHNGKNLHSAPFLRIVIFQYF